MVDAETRSKIIVVAIISACIAAAILLGVIIFELPWHSNSAANKSQRNLTFRGTALPEHQSSAASDVDNLAQGEILPPLSSLEKAIWALERFPVIDGHNDFPWSVRNLLQNDLSRVNFSEDLTRVEPWVNYTRCHTDLPRLRKGRVGGQFWAAFTECKSQYKDSALQTLEQIDVIHRLIKKYPNDLEFCESANDVRNAIKAKKIASLIGIEGGHSIHFSVGVLRQMYRLGARYLTLTHTCNTPWADASPVDDPENPLPRTNPDGGVSAMGLEIVDEMNRLGMMIDLSHVSEATMRTVLARSRAPVIFSHSAAKAICAHHRNVGNEVLQLLKRNGGVIMVTFVTHFVQCNHSRNATIDDVVEHIEHIRSLIGVNHVGIGGDYNGVDSVPQGLEDTSKYPYLFAKLVERGWGLTELGKLSSENILRVMTAVEKVRDDLSSVPPMESVLLSRYHLEQRNVSDTCLSSKSLYSLAYLQKNGSSTTNTAGNKG